MYDGVDKSYDQCRLANYVVTGGDEDCLSDGIRFRRRLPEGTGNHREQYNMVLVQNVLGDQRSRKERLYLLDRLWSKVHVNGGIMVIIDSGNLPGHEITQVLGILAFSVTYHKACGLSLSFSDCFLAPNQSQFSGGARSHTGKSRKSFCRSSVWS